VLDDGTFVAAVADGAGSAPLGGEGAAIAAQAAVEAVDRTRMSAWPEAGAWRPFFLEVFRAAQQGVFDEAARLGREPRDLATTLIVTVLTATQAAAAQVGDGAAVIEPDGEPYRALTVPSLGEYANETVFLVSAEALASMQTGHHSGAARAAALFSDGLQRVSLRLPGGEPHAAFFEPVFQFTSAATDTAAAAVDLARWLGSPKVTSRADDDLTLVAACRAR
jgi:hypothetical protein